MGNNSVHGLKRRRKKSAEDKLETYYAGKDDRFGRSNVMDFYDERDYLSEQSVEKIDPRSLEDTPVQKFYRGKNILITGASGFIGTILLEKLLRTTEPNQIYVLFRSRRSQSLAERIKEYFQDDVFDRLKKERPNFAEKIVMLEADLQSEGLGLSDEHRDFLIAHVNIILHVAATVKFDEHLRTAYEINVSGTERLLNLAENMNNLVSFVYVSTAYSNCNISHIEEKFYTPLFTHVELKQILDACSDVDLTILNPLIIKSMPNTYTLTKNTTENLCKLRRDKLPIGILRPSIVMPVENEPLPYWVKGMTGLTAAYVAVGTGIMRTVYQNTENLIDIVPGDYVVNAIISVGWEIGCNRNKAENVVSRNTIKNIPVEKKVILDNSKNSVKLCEDVTKSKNGAAPNRKHIYERTISQNTLKRNWDMSEQFIDENNNPMMDDIDDAVPSANVDGPLDKLDCIYNMVSCVENPITLGRSNELTIHFSNVSGEGCPKSVWIIHHNPTSNKWLYFTYFYLLNILPALVFFVFLEKLSGKKAQLMKIYRKVFFLNETIAAFSINEWKFSNQNARTLFDELSERDKQLFNFSMKKLMWEDYHSILYRGLSMYLLGGACTQELYNTRVRYMKIADTIVVYSFKALLLYSSYALVSALFTYVKSIASF